MIRRKVFREEPSVLVLGNSGASPHGACVPVMEMKEPRSPGGVLGS